jgi:hypothetical protein
MSHRDLATGNTNLNTHQNYRTVGPASSFGTKGVLPAAPPIQCNTWQVDMTCTSNQIAALEVGTAAVKDYIIVSPAS